MIEVNRIQVYLEGVMVEDGYVDPSFVFTSHSTMNDYAFDDTLHFEYHKKSSNVIYVFRYNDDFVYRTAVNIKE